MSSRHRNFLGSIRSIDNWEKEEVDFLLEGVTGSAVTMWEKRENNNEHSSSLSNIYSIISLRAGKD